MCFFIFGCFHVIGSLLMAISFIGFGMNFLCYLFNKGMFFQMWQLWLLLGIGFVIEAIGVILSIILMKKGI